jgi:DNA polymerase beta
VYGIGPVAARNLYNQGIRSINDLRLHKDKLNHHQKIGLKYFSDLEERIPREEMLKIQDLLQKEIESLDSKCAVTLVDSFRRGLY